LPAAAALTAERNYAQCDDANPNGKDSGTAFLGGPKTSGPFDGLQAEYACVPFAHVGLVRLPDEISDDQAILISDILPTGYFGADIANVHDGSTVVIFGCGPVGQFTIASRLQMASEQGAETIDFNSEDPLETILELTNGIGVDKAIDAVGVDAVHPSKGPAHKAAQDKEFQTEVKAIVSKSKPDGDNWHPGDAPSQVVKWAVESLAKVGTLSVIGVYPDAMQTFPLGNFMEKNLTLRAGNCNHRKYVPKLVDLVRMGQVNPAEVLTQAEPITSAIEAYKLFDRRAPGWVKVELKPAVARAHSG
jgi:threonine dehydrogenase-like Zn-dependent dehydrogenase